MPTIEVMLQTIVYVSSAPYFYSLTGMTIATAMFIGATVYNGELKQASKGVVTIAGYTIFMLLMISSRVVNTLSLSTAINHTEYQAWAGIATVIISSIEYIIGMLLGVFVSQQAKHKVRQERIENDRKKA